MNNTFMNRTNSHRNGTILIIVAGISALLAAMALTFLVRMRSDVQESSNTVREAQAHIMMVAACNFVMEKARLGWSPKPISGGLLTVRREAFGWIDVRTGKPGPLDENGNKLGLETAGTWDKWVDLNLTDAERPAKRCPMYVMMRPPYAVSPRVAVNPIAISGPEMFMPYVAKADPQKYDNLMTPAQYINGDQRIDSGRHIPSWFRVWRAGPASFVITCGVGDTQGFRNWGEVVSAGQQDFFAGGGESLFAVYQAQEIRLQYLIEWSAHVASSEYALLENEFEPKQAGSYLHRPINLSQDDRSQGKQVNPVGTISFIQRLINEPTHW